MSADTKKKPRVQESISQPGDLKTENVKKPVKNG